MTRVDVTIRGAGILGLSTAWACLSRGARVTVIDPHGPGAGSSGGIVGALAPHVPENWNAKKAFQLESLLLADAFWTQVEAVSGMASGYTRSGRIQPISDQRALELAHERARSARTLWPDAVTWDVVPDGHSIWGVVSPFGWIIHDTLSALLHPRQAIAALSSGLTAQGVPIVPDGPDAGRVIWATGVAGLEDLNRVHHRNVGTGVKGQAALFKANATGAAQLFIEGLHIIPHRDGTVAIGSTTEREYHSATTTDQALDRLIETARAAVPLLQTADVIDRWAGVRPRARSRAPMLGKWPGKPGHFIANGGFKIGFGMAPKISEVMADLVLEDTNTIPEGFDVAASL